MKVLVEGPGVAKLQEEGVGVGGVMEMEGIVCSYGEKKPGVVGGPSGVVCFFVNSNFGCGCNRQDSPNTYRRSAGLEVDIGRHRSIDYLAR